MTYIIQDLADAIVNMDENVLVDSRDLYLLLNRAVGAIDSRDREIKRLQIAIMRGGDLLAEEIKRIGMDDFE
jgi:hypothetical protein